MPLRLLNDYLLVEPDVDHYASENAEVVRLLKEGLILAPENTSIRVKANTGTVISAGPRCHYKFKVGQKVYFAQWVKASYYFDGDKKYRFFCEHEINAVEE